MWPGLTWYIDNFAPNTPQWWEEAMHNMSQLFDFTGIWSDMNEMSSFRMVDRTYEPAKHEYTDAQTRFLWDREWDYDATQSAESLPLIACHFMLSSPPAPYAIHNGE